MAAPITTPLAEFLTGRDHNARFLAGPYVCELSCPDYAREPRLAHPSIGIVVQPGDGSYSKDCSPLGCVMVAQKLRAALAKKHYTVVPLSSRFPSETLDLRPPAEVNLETIYKDVKGACMEVGRGIKAQEQKTASDKARRKAEFLDGDHKGYFAVECSPRMWGEMKAKEWMADRAAPVTFDLTHADAKRALKPAARQGETRDISEIITDCLSGQGYHLSPFRESASGSDGGHHVVSVAITPSAGKTPESLFDDLWDALQRGKAAATARCETPSPPRF